jgi:hypothetical protein
MPVVISGGETMRLIVTLIFSVCFLFLGCNAVSDMKGMFGKQELVQRAIKEKHGLESRIGWNMNNGVLTQGTVTFDGGQVRDKKVSELETVDELMENWHRAERREDLMKVKPLD